MTAAEYALWGLRQGGLRSEEICGRVFLEVSTRLRWDDTALSACFHLGLDYETIRCNLTISNFPLIKLIYLVLFLNGSDLEVEVIPESCHPAPAGTRGASPAHPMPRISTYLQRLPPPAKLQSPS